MKIYKNSKMMNISREEPENSKELAKVTQQLAQLLKPRNGKDGADGRDVEIRVTADFIQARLMGDAWNNLISVADLKGDKGDKGLDGKNGLDGKDGVGKNGLDGKNGLNGKDGKDGKDGDQLRLRKDRTHIQWKLDNDTEWKNLVSLEELRGPAGVTQVIHSGGGNAGQGSGETPPPSEGAVDSVNGQSGVVVLTQDDIGDGDTYKRYSETEQNKLSGIQAGAEVNAVDSVNGQSGAVSLGIFDLDDAQLGGPVAASQILMFMEDTQQWENTDVSSILGSITTDDLAEGSNNFYISEAERDKLAFITVDEAIDLGGVAMAVTQNTVNIVAVTDDYEITDTDDLVLVDDIGVVITLSNSVTAMPKPYSIKNRTAGNISFQSSGGQLVDGVESGTIIPNQTLTIVPFESTWNII